MEDDQVLSLNRPESWLTEPLKWTTLSTVSDLGMRERTVRVESRGSESYLIESVHKVAQKSVK